MEATRWKNASEGASNCVDVAHTRDMIRDSKNPNVILAVTPAAVTQLFRSLGR